VSEGDFASLNLGVVTEDRTSDVMENRLRLAGALGIESARVSMGFQVHGKGLSWADARNPGAYADPKASPPIEADGQLSDESGRPLLVLVADCLPVALLGDGEVSPRESSMKR
jgi:copper oxidase (laccase) domain-containing protein